ncbi:hypothetical protein ECC29_05825 [Helicobacter pylori]|nr:hypothetical protein ECC29_05825 [Helicobacter pylori]
MLACFVRVSNIFYKALTSGNKNFYSDRGFIDFKGASLYSGITLNASEKCYTRNPKNLSPLEQI